MMESSEPGEPMKLLDTVTTPAKVPAPFSKSEFLHRLESFKPSTYFGKPECLSPIICARFGWSNPTADIVVCEHCNAALAIKLHSSLTPATRRKMAQEYRLKLCSAHKVTCPFFSQRVLPNDGAIPSWMASVVPDYIMELMDSPTPGLVAERKMKEIEELIGANHKLEIDLSALGKRQGLVMDVLFKLGFPPKSYHSLVIFGWEPVEAKDSKLQCGLCLAQYESDRAGDDNQSTDPPTSKRQRISNTKDLLYTHRHYCPIQCGFPTDSALAQPLWQEIANRILDELPPQELDPLERFQSIQQMLSSAISDSIAERKKTNDALVPSCRP